MIGADEFIMLPILVAFDWAFYERTAPLFERFDEQPEKWSETLHPRWIATVAGLGAIALDSLGFGPVFRWVGMALFSGSLALGVFLGWKERRGS